jgi:hypothetical protein
MIRTPGCSSKLPMNLFGIYDSNTALQLKVTDEALWDIHDSNPGLQLETTDETMWVILNSTPRLQL